jgi:hypothetical protein
MPLQRGEALHNACVSVLLREFNTMSDEKVISNLFLKKYKKEYDLFINKLFMHFLVIVDKKKSRMNS